jgi:hypothetical protein
VSLSLRNSAPCSSSAADVRSRLGVCASHGSSARSGSSAAAHGRCAAAISELCGSVVACSGPRAKNARGWLTRYWSSASGCATSAIAASPRRPTRPLRCQVAIWLPGYPTRMQTSSPPTSMPSSSAEVAITPESEPVEQPTLDLAALGRQESRAIAADPRGELGLRLDDPVVQQLGDHARLRERDRAQPRASALRNSFAASV